MAADDLVLDMIKTHSRYDMPEDITLSCPDVPECPSFPRGAERSLRPVGKEVNGLFKETKTSDWAGEKTTPGDWPTEKLETPDWTKQKNDITGNFHKKNVVGAWEPVGVRGDLSNEEGSDSRITDEEDLGSHKISQEDPASHRNGPTSHKIGLEDPDSHLFGQNGITDNATAAHKCKGDGSQTELRTSAIGRPGVDVEDDWWDSEGRPTGERWPPLGAPDDRAEDGHSFDSW